MCDDSPTERDTPAFPNNGQHQAREGRIPIGELHRLLASARRRTVVSFLATYPDGAVPFDDLVAVVAQSECPRPGPGTLRVRVTADLHHVHLPKLDAAGVVSYHPEAGTVEYHESPALESHLATSDHADDTDEQL